MNVDTHAELKRSHVVAQLRELGCYTNDHDTYNELVRKLAVARAMEVEIPDSGNGWF